MQQPWRSIFLRGDAPGVLWLNRPDVVLVIWAHFDGNEAALSRCADHDLSAANLVLPELFLCGSGEFPKCPGASKLLQLPRREIISGAAPPKLLPNKASANQNRGGRRSATGVFVPLSQR